MTTGELALKIGKLAAQLLGAILVARLAVFWALSRYKSEKTWERQLAAIVDAVTALSGMRTLVGRWFDRAITYRDLSEAVSEKQQARYLEASRRLNDGIAAAQLVLPQPVADRLSQLTKEMDAAQQGNDYVSELDELYGVIDRALRDTIEQGCEVLKTGLSKAA